MKLASILAAILSGTNLYFGVRFLLNVFGILQTTKYGPVATAIYGVLFTGLGIAGLYVAFWLGNGRMALLLGAAPWAIALVLVVVGAAIGLSGR